MIKNKGDVRSSNRGGSAKLLPIHLPKYTVGNRVIHRTRRTVTAGRTGYEMQTFAKAIPNREAKCCVDVRVTFQTCVMKTFGYKGRTSYKTYEEFSYGSARIRI